MSITDHHINDCNRVIRVFRGHPVKDGATPDGNCYTIHAEGEAASDGVLVGYAVEYTLRFHTGDPREGINGVTNEALLAVVLDRLLHGQEDDLECVETGRRHELPWTLHAREWSYIKRKDDTLEGVGS